jgi:hypothetical protein
MRACTTGIYTIFSITDLLVVVSHVDVMTRNNL